MGCSYEKEGEYNKGLKCFIHLSKIYPTMSEALYGVALCLFKIKNYQEALKHIENAIKVVSNDDKNLNYYQYLKAVCYKELGDYESAAEYYKKVAKNLLITEAPKVTKYTLYDKYYNPKNGWNIDMKSKILSTLQERPFFKRFNLDTIEHIFKLFELRIYDRNSLLFLSENETGVFLQGEAVMYSYVNNLNNPKIIAEFFPGSVIGHSSIDNGICHQSEHWIHTKCNLEMCIFTKENFNV